MQETRTKQGGFGNLRTRRVQLIFNPIAGTAKAAPELMVDVVREMRALNLVPEAFLVEPGCDLPGAIRDARARGIRMFVVCGGDGTISSVARILAGTPSAPVTLGIIPVGTQNNMALSLGIPTDIPAATAILRTGNRIKVDVGMATYQAAEGGEVTTPFLETCTIGLAAALFPSADDIQHGNLARVGDFLATLVSTPPAQIHLVLDGKQEIHDLGHVVLVSNMPHIGRHYEVAPAASFRDGWLDVLYFSNLSKLDLLGYVFHGVGLSKSEDQRIQHYRARRVEIRTEPAMPLMADGYALGEGWVRIEVRRRILAVMAGKSAPEVPIDHEKRLEAQTHAGSA